jgi:putative flippase GtrA
MSVEPSVCGPIGSPRSGTSVERDRVRALAERLPRPLRFLCVGGLGLITDIALFTILLSYGTHPLGARLMSLAVATIITWRLNRALTFDRSGRRQGEEAVRYAAVTVTAQAASYCVFAVLVLTILAAMPQLALVIGAVIGAVVSYNGHRHVAFAPRKPLVHVSQS